jgi:Zn-dependent protease
MRIAGIDIGIHYTWILIFVLLSWSLAQGFFPQLYPGWDTITYWITGVVAALLLFGSVLLHELAHSLVAQARGLTVTNITLFIFGGVSNLEEEPDKLKVELAMSIVAPLVKQWQLHMFPLILLVPQFMPYRLFIKSPILPMLMPP